MHTGKLFFYLSSTSIIIVVLTSYILGAFTLIEKQRFYLNVKLNNHILLTRPAIDM